VLVFSVSLCLFTIQRFQWHPDHRSGLLINPNFDIRNRHPVGDTGSVGMGVSLCWLRAGIPDSSSIRWLFAFCFQTSFEVKQGSVIGTVVTSPKSAICEIL
jgi:hypothetical protein